MIRSLREVLDDLYISTGIYTGAKKNLLEEACTYETRAREGGKYASWSENAHGQEIDVLVATTCRRYLAL